MAAPSLAQDAAVPLLRLPDPFLLAVLRCCDTRSICSAARAHSRLHQAAAATLTSVTLETNNIDNQQQQLDSLVDVYLPRYGEHVDSISLGPGQLQQLPTTLTKLTSLTARRTDMQLLPGCGFQGVLGAAVTPPLKRLRLNHCILMMDAFSGEGLTAALALLPGLQHLSLIDNRNVITEKEIATAGGNVLLKLQQLTYLELRGVWQEPADSDYEGDPADALDPAAVDFFKLQHLVALKRLADLRLKLPGFPCSIKASMLSSAQRLTHLQLQTTDSSEFCFEPGVLAGKTLLQHLQLQCCYMAGHEAGYAQLLSELSKLQQLTCLILNRCLYVCEDGPSAKAYSALTASSKLQHLDVRECTFPEGVWQHVFPAGRQLPHMRELDISEVLGIPLTAADGISLVSCCPGLQSLNMRGLPCSHWPTAAGGAAGPEQSEHAVPAASHWLGRGVGGGAGVGGGNGGCVSADRAAAA